MNLEKAFILFLLLIIYQSGGRFIKSLVAVKRTREEEKK